jgi:CIC family chloride channel protein
VKFGVRHDALNAASAALVATRPRLLAVVTAALVGLVTGAAAIAFREAFGSLQWLLFGAPLDSAEAASLRIPPGLLLAIPAAGGLITGLICFWLLPDRRPHGVSDAVESAALQAGRLDIRTGLAAAAASVVSLGTGASVGREGPMIHLGATLGSWLTRRLGLPADFARRMLACGAAAGVAASFNAPIAGVIFAVEVVVGRYTLRSFAPIVVSSVVATVLSRIAYGEDPAFVVPEVSIGSYWEMPAFVIVGLAGSLVTITLIRSIAVVGHGFARLPIPAWLQPALAGLGVGAIALLAPQVLGVGYGTTSAALAGQIPSLLLLTILLAKVVATAVSVGGGLAGGIFSPSLMLGALTGSLAGSIATALYPEHASPQAVYTLIGMGAVAGAALGSPLSTTLIVLELSGNYPVTLAVMLATVLSSLIVNDIWGHSFFSWQLSRRGIDLRMRRVDALLKGQTLAEMKHHAVTPIPAGTLWRDVRMELAASGAADVVVVDGQGGVLGKLGRDSLIYDQDAIESAMQTDVLTLMPDTTLDVALAQVRAHPGASVYLVEDDIRRRPTGAIDNEELMRAYQRVLDRVYAEEYGDAAASR